MNHAHLAPQKSEILDIRYFAASRSNHGGQIRWDLTPVSMIQFTLGGEFLRSDNISKNASGGT
jgi:hypothetical protein